MVLAGCTLDRLPARVVANDAGDVASVDVWAVEISSADSAADDGASVADVVHAETPDTLEDVSSDAGDSSTVSDAPIDTPAAACNDVCATHHCEELSGRNYCCTQVDAGSCASFCDIPNMCTFGTAGIYYCCRPL